MSNKPEKHEKRKTKKCYYCYIVSIWLLLNPFLGGFCQFPRTGHLVFFHFSNAQLLLCFNACCIPWISVSSDCEGLKDFTGWKDQYFTYKIQYKEYLLCLLFRHRFFSHDMGWFFGELFCSRCAYPSQYLSPVVLLSHFVSLCLCFAPLIVPTHPSLPFLKQRCRRDAHIIFSSVCINGSAE